ncbi:type IX secretion system membrane protein PorP/SprF [Sporocytophaga myxococcoides]|uniref:type IX secretion system membrane protein PorP/SprF n=1 Tax=Sporocytophaga myxococcoides TaxID=153721 RepID=UPI00048FB5CC|nr:type IX secretion system membrane protein PorP/SprF [Sporocytophaga myxococcoides]
MRFFFVYISLIFICYSSNAQEAYIYPLNFLRLKNNYIFENPAASTLTEKGEINLIHSAFSGLLNNVGINYLEASYSPGKSNDTPVHTFGLTLHSEYETEILKRNRFYLRYCRSIQLSSSVKLAAALQAGVFNYLVKSTQNSSGSSSTIPDASVGLWLASKNFNIGISGVQLLASEIKPVYRTYALGSYINLFMDYRKAISSSAELILGMKLYKGKGYYEGLWLSATLEFMNNFSAGVNYLWKQGPVVSLGIVKFNFLKIHSDLYFSYFHPTSTDHLANTGRYEVSIHIFPFNVGEKDQPDEDTE